MSDRNWNNEESIIDSYAVFVRFQKKSWISFPRADRFTVSSLVKEMLVNSDSFLVVLQNAKDGDEQALNQLMERFRYVVDGECRRINLPAADISHSDLRQESWLRAWQKLDSFECSENGEFESGNYVEVVNRFAAWLRTTTRNIAHDVLAKRQAQKRNPDRPIVPFDGSINVLGKKGDSNLTPSKEIANKEEVANVKKAIRDLADPISQQIIRLYFEKGASFEKIAREFDLTYDQVRLRFHRALRKIENELFL